MANESRALDALDTLEASIELIPKLPGMAKRAAAEIIGDLRAELIAGIEWRKRVDARLAQLEQPK